MMYDRPDIERMEDQRRELAARLRAAPLKEALAIQKELDRLDAEIALMERADRPGQLKLF